ncbi:MAG: UDP-N-acetylmuramoyl-L-alanine--D-glutamate ligase [Candidatus Staskawiczbacteria bacterium]|nr:UDP-N-acetylmuramoyl-L-alanine--D-glutamate ligase [Candidatus Staskawiczbacteria bacterium]
MSKKIFQGKKVTVMGLGLHGGGVGVAKFFCEQGAEVLVTDLKTEEKLEDSINKLKGLKIKYTLGKHQEADFISADLIIKNPDVPSTSPYLEIAKKNNVPVETDVSLFFKLSGAFIIGVTGTKGKSTTSSLIYHIIKTKYKNTFLAGNIGVSPLELLSEVKKGDKVVLELSSFELEDLTQSPNIAVITNILPDHLNRYGTMEEYIKSKKIIFEYQTKKDHLILNEDDDILRRFAEERSKISIVRQFSLNNKPKDINLDNLKLLGEHNLQNILAAIEVAKILKIPEKTIEKALKTFKGVPSRQEFIREVRGVKYFNDTTATMPDATITAIRVFLENFPNSRLILICGGQNKGLKYEKLAEIIRERVDEVIMLPGTASDKIKENLKNYTRVHEVSLMQEAVKKAKEFSEKGDVVILSPAAASFNLFKNEFDRGDQFVKAVKNLK